MGMRRPGLSWSERNELWRRWRPASRRANRARCTGISIRLRAPRGGGRRRAASAPRSGRALTRAAGRDFSRSGRGQSLRAIAPPCAGRPRPLAARFGGMAAGPLSRGAGRSPRVAECATAEAVPLAVGARLRASSPRSCARIGRRSRLPAGSSRLFRMLTCTSRTRRSIGRCLCKARGRSNRSWSRICGSSIRVRHARAPPRGRAPRPDCRRGLHPRPPGRGRDRALPGHWEGDLLAGQSAPISRRCRAPLPLRAAGAAARERRRRARAHAPRAPAARWADAIADVGSRHRRPRTAHSRWRPTCRSTSAIPHSPWQRGSNENTNGLLRHTFRKARISHLDPGQLDAVAQRLNTRPRLTLGLSNARR